MGKEATKAPNTDALDFTDQLLTQDDVFKQAEKVDTDDAAEKTAGLTQEQIFNEDISLNKEEKTTKETKKTGTEQAAADKEKSSTPDSEEITAARAGNKTPDSLVFAKSLKEQGLLDELDEEAFMKIHGESGEDFFEPLKVTIQESFARKEAKMVEELNEQVKSFKEWKQLADQGINPQEAFTIAYQKEKLGAITEDALKENQELRKDVLFNLYKETTDWSDGEIENFINDQVSLKKDTDLAKGAIPKLQTIYDAREKQMVDQENVRRQQEEKSLKDSLEDLRKKIPDEFLGTKLHSKTKDELYDMIAKPVVKYPDGSTANVIWAEYNKDPNTFMLKIAGMMKTGVWDGKIDRIKQATKNEVTEEMQKVIQRQTEKTRQSGGIAVTDKETPSYKSMKERAEKRLQDLAEQKLSPFGNI